MLVSELGEPEEMLKELEIKDSLSTEQKKKVEKKPLLSEYKMQQILDAVKNSPGQQITAAQLADQLMITKRSANRLLSAMEEEGRIVVAGTRATAAKGRPERIYQIEK
jgi:response regulator of citrate/malate metabolism